jgi:hypothetical protein
MGKTEKNAEHKSWSHEVLMIDDDLLFFIVFTPEKCWVKQKMEDDSLEDHRSQLVIRSLLWIHGIVHGILLKVDVDIAGGPLLDVDKEQWIHSNLAFRCGFFTFLSIWSCDLLCYIVFPLHPST